MAQNREFTVVVWGASGCVGRLVTEYLIDNYAGDKSIKFAIAGRNLKKLNDVVSSLSARFGKSVDVPIIVADGELNSIAKRTRAVISVVGPFIEAGEPMVKACVEEATNYVDITGEVVWAKEMQTKYGAEAERKNIKIVNFCGFDSLPFDLTAFAVQIKAKQEFGAPVQSIHSILTECQGGLISGSSVHALLRFYDEVNPKLAVQLLDDHNYLVEDKHKSQIGSQLTAPEQPYFSNFFKTYSSKYMRAIVNSKVVRRSASLLQDFYIDKKSGDFTKSSFEYKEGIATPNAVAHNALTASLAVGSIALFLCRPLRWAISKVVPRGYGPSRQSMDSGKYTIEAVGSTKAKGQKEGTPVLRSFFHGNSDPGFTETAKFVAEAGLAAALIGSRKESVPSKYPLANGVTTPAASLGEELIDRLKKRNVEIIVSKI